MTSALGQAKLGCSTGALRARQPAAAARSAPLRTQAAAGGTALNEMVPDRWAWCSCTLLSLRCQLGRGAPRLAPTEAKVQPASAHHGLADQLAGFCHRSKRTTMNWLLVGGLGLPGTAMLGPFAYFFKPNM